MKAEVFDFTARLRPLGFGAAAFARFACQFMAPACRAEPREASEGWGARQITDFLETTATWQLGGNEKKAIEGIALFKARLPPRACAWRTFRTALAVWRRTSQLASARKIQLGE